MKHYVFAVFASLLLAACSQQQPAPLTGAALVERGAYLVNNIGGCNDCHTPHSLIPKYLVKAENGFWHSFYFTTGLHPDPIQAREVSVRIAEKNCRRCHAEVVDQIDSRAVHGRELDCIRCHRDVGHPNR